MTASTTTEPAKKKAPAKPKAPIEHAKKHLAKQAEAIASSKLDDRVKAQVCDWLNGLKRALETIDQVVDPDNPPPGEGVHGRLIAFGRGQRALQQVLAGAGISSSADDEDEDEEPLHGAGSVTAHGVALAARQGANAASIGI